MKNAVAISVFLFPSLFCPAAPAPTFKTVTVRNLTLDSLKVGYGDYCGVFYPHGFGVSSNRGMAGVWLDRHEPPCYLSWDNTMWTNIRVGPNYINLFDGQTKYLELDNFLFWE